MAETQNREFRRQYICKCLCNSVIDRLYRSHGDRGRYSGRNNRQLVDTCNQNSTDFIIIMVMTCSIGKGSIFSAIPVFVFEGLITVLASWLKPIMTDLATGLSFACRFHSYILGWVEPCMGQKNKSCKYASGNYICCYCCLFSDLILINEVLSIRDCGMKYICVYAYNAFRILTLVA